MHASTLGLSSLCTKCSIAMVPLLKQSANTVIALTTLILTCLSAHPWCDCAPGAMPCCIRGAAPNQGMALCAGHSYCVSLHGPMACPSRVQDPWVLHLFFLCSQEGHVPSNVE